MTEYVEINRASWDERVPAHAASPDYGLDRFAADPDHLSDVVRFDRPRLGDIAGARGIHLQCHMPGYMAEIGGGEHRLIDRPERLPHSYTLTAVKLG